MTNVEVSVIITTKNEEKNISNLLISLRQQTFENFEIIVVDNFSTDRTKDIVVEHGARFYQAGPERSAQRNFGVSQSYGKYILILDADMMLTSEVLESCVENIKNNPHIKTIVIPEKSIGENFWSRCKAFERNFYFLDTSENLIEAPRFFPKDVFLEFGGYDEKITGPEDWDLPERINKEYPGRIKVKPHILHNEGRISLRKLMKKKFYYGQKTSYYLQKNQIAIVNSKNIYFLRPVFYKFWREWFREPLISIGTIYMLTLEFIAGGFGYVFGKYLKKHE